MSKEAKAAAKILERSRVMGSVRAPWVIKFESYVEEVVASRKFVAGECIVYEIAKDVAEKMGIRKASVKRSELDLHGRRCAQFTQSLLTKLPAPAKGKKGDPDVKTTTIYKIEKQSALIVVSYAKIGEDGVQIGEDVPLLRLKRPQVDGSGGGASSSGGKW